MHKPSKQIKAKTPIDVSIIIISYNTREITKNCIESILTSIESSALNFEVVIVDNNSQDGSVAMIQEYNKHYDALFTLILNSDNYGFGAANNQAVERSRGEYILLLNSDTIVLEDAIDQLHTFATQNPDKHFLGAKLLNEDLTPQDSCGPNYSLPVVFVHLLLFGDRWPRWRVTRFSPDKLQKVGWVSGACIFTKKAYYEKLHGFDEKIFMYMEEIDLLYRAQMENYTIYFVPQSRIIHLGSASSKSANKRTDPILQVYRGLIYYYHKHHGPFSQFMLRCMLQLKACIGIVVGRASGNQYLIHTYEKALTLASSAE